MSCPHSNVPSASPERCSLCLGTIVHVIRRIDEVTVDGDLVMRDSRLTDGRTTRAFTPGEDGLTRRQRRMKRRKTRDAQPA
jgi:hypothetical protein